MSDQSCRSLFDLYVRAGEHLVGLGKKRQAADAFALALYYATELGNPQAQRFCRQRIVHCDSGHEAARVPTPPLVFAKLLMTFPSDIAEQALHDQAPKPQESLPELVGVLDDPAGYRSMGVYVLEEREMRSGDFGSTDAEISHAVDNEPPFFALEEEQTETIDAGTPSDSIRTSVLEEVGALSKQPSIYDMDVSSQPTTIAPLADISEASCAPLSSTASWKAAPIEPASDSMAAVQGAAPNVPDIFPSPPPAADWRESASLFEEHHVYDLGAGPAGVRPESIRAVEDLLLSGPRPLADRFDEEPSVAGGLLNFAAGVVAALGIGCVGFFGYSLYPRMKQFDVNRFVETMTNAGGGQSRVEIESAVAPVIVKDAAEPALHPTSTVIPSPPAKWLGDERPAVFEKPDGK